jgi:hypothetical protein
MSRLDVIHKFVEFVQRQAPCLVSDREFFHVGLLRRGESQSQDIASEARDMSPL